MPRTRTVLDSSPVEVPSKKQDKLPDPNPTEKLDSKPSLRALPTPPRTRPSHKRRRGRRTSRVTDSDSEDDHLDPPKGPSESTKDGLSVPTSDKDALVLGHKKRKMFQLDVIAEELSNRAAEDEFWTGSSSNPLPNPTSSHSNTRGRTLSRSPTRSPSSSPPTRKLRRSNTGLFSPPPSKRHPTTVLPRLLTPPPAPRTPPPKERKNSVRRKLFPERDSPNNPFLANEDDDDLEAAQKLTPEPHTPLRHVERPTVTYVFRGVKGVFENPLYDPSHPDGVPPASPGSPSQLPPSDPDFSPTPYCPPKLLFPEARSRDHARRLRRRKETTTGDADPFNGESSKVTKPSSNGSTGKGKQVRPPRQKSEWDTSDEEDAPPPEHERHRPGFTREREKTRVKSPAVVTRALEVPQEKVEVVPTETIGDRPKRTLRRSTRQIPAKR